MHTSLPPYLCTGAHTCERRGKWGEQHRRKRETASKEEGNSIKGGGNSITGGGNSRTKGLRQDGVHKKRASMAGAEGLGRADHTFLRETSVLLSGLWGPSGGVFLSFVSYLCN